MKRFLPNPGRWFRVELACALAVLLVTAPGLPNNLALPLALGTNSNIPAPFEEDDQEVPAAVRLHESSVLPKCTRPARTTRRHGLASRCPPSSTALLRDDSNPLREPADHFRNGLGTPRLC